MSSGLDILRQKKHWKKYITNFAIVYHCVIRDGQDSVVREGYFCPLGEATFEYHMAIIAAAIDPETGEEVSLCYVYEIDEFLPWEELEDSFSLHSLFTTGLYSHYLINETSIGPSIPISVLRRTNPYLRSTWEELRGDWKSFSKRANKLTEVDAPKLFLPKIYEICDKDAEGALSRYDKSGRTIWVKQPIEERARYAFLYPWELFNQKHPKVDLDSFMAEIRMMSCSQAQKYVGYDLIHSGTPAYGRMIKMADIKNVDATLVINQELTRLFEAYGLYY